jgi:hypothetical protein
MKGLTINLVSPFFRKKGIIVKIFIHGKKLYSMFGERKKIMEIKAKCEELFDTNFNCKKNDAQEIVSFCDEITRRSKIQVCTPKGQMYEYLPETCRSVIKESTKVEQPQLMECEN